MKNSKQLLLLPITIWSGLEQGFFGADFTAVSIVVYVLRNYWASYSVNTCLLVRDFLNIRVLTFNSIFIFFRGAHYVKDFDG